MSERLGMADGRCFTISTASTLLNDYVMEQNGIIVQDNYSYRKLLQSKGPEILAPFKREGDCINCDKPYLNVSGTY